MGQKLNHHFVPQHHLRLFSGGTGFIRMVTRDGSRVVPKASIRHQCAKHRYYQSDQVENWLGRLETRHAITLRRVVTLASQGAPRLSVWDNYYLREAALLQRQRTPRNAQLGASSSDKATLHAFRQHLAGEPRDKDTREALRAIDEGRVTLEGSEAFTVMVSLSAVEESVPLLADLNLLVLRNETDVPFVLGDNPCVFTNHRFRDVQGYGVLGFASRGLMISMPLTPDVEILMYDSSCYSLRDAYAPVISLQDRQDVQQLNEVQVQSSLSAVYFRDESVTEYVQSLVVGTPQCSLEGGFLVYEPVAPELREREQIMATYEPQLPTSLDMTFLETLPAPRGYIAFRPRWPEQVARVEGALGLDQTGPMPMEELLKQVRHQIRVAPSDA